MCCHQALRCAMCDQGNGFGCLLLSAILGLQPALPSLAGLTSITASRFAALHAARTVTALVLQLAAPCTDAAMPTAEQ